jgi:hypothetical protein
VVAEGEQPEEIADLLDAELLELARVGAADAGQRLQRQVGPEPHPTHRFRGFGSRDYGSRS